MRAIDVIALTTFATGLFGCATPQVALDQANNTAGLVAQLEIEMREFRRVQNGIAEQAKESIRGLQVGALASNVETDASMRARTAAEDPVVPKIYALVRHLADGIGIDRSNLIAEIAAVDDRLSKLLKPLPSTDEKTSEAQMSLAAMGSELSNKARLAEIQEFYKTVKAGVDANRQKIKDAKSK